MRALVLVVLLAVLLAGCGPEGWTYRSDCLEVRSFVGLYEVKVTRNLAVAQEMFDSKFGSGSLCVLDVQPIEVRNEFQFDCPWLPQQTCTGFTDATGHIQLGLTGRALLHELLHVQDQHQGIWDTGNHPQWTEKGYYEMDATFKDIAADYWFTP